MVWDWAAFFHYIFSPYLLTGAVWSLGLSIGAMLIGLVLGGVAAMMRMSDRRWLRLPASGYVWLFRGTPVLVQLIIIYTGLPQLGIQLGVVASALIGLGVNEGAYLAEIIRSGISAVPKGQFEAARAIGMTWPKTMRVVVMPQAMRDHHSAARQRLQRPDEDLVAGLRDLDGGVAAPHRAAGAGAVQGARDLHRRGALLSRC